jgi:cytoskeletal protein CcmA (bactofilin family)
MANQYAAQDQNQVFALIGHSGTADPVETRRIVAENGAMWTSIQGGTVNVGGTIAATVSGTVPVSGTVGVSGTIPVTGTVSAAISGTVPVSGTVGVSGTIPVSGNTAIDGTVPVSGTVAVSGTVPVSGTVAVSGTQTVQVNQGTLTAYTSLVNFVYDAVVVTYPSGTTDVFTFKTGGTAGSNVGTITINYTATNKGSVSSVIRS